MKKVLSILFVSALFVWALSLSSCNKCAVCQYTYENLQGEQETFTYSEVCGKNSEVNDYKDACASAAAAYTNGNCTCVDE